MENADSVIAGDFSYPLTGKRIWVAGHTGMVGSAVMRILKARACDILTVSHDVLDLRDQAGTYSWLEENRPDVVVMAAARVGGIVANNSHPAQFLYDNMMMAGNVIEGARRAGVARLLYLGSSCVYPRDCVQPMSENMLLSGVLEPTNEAYAIAKIAGLKMAQFYRVEYGCDYISAMPCNLFGVGDSYDVIHSHVIPAMIMKAHMAKVSGDDTLRLWGSGRPLREFLYVDDLAEMLVLLLERYSESAPVNVGSGFEISIADLAACVCDVVGFRGQVDFDNTMPDGVARKVLDNRRIMSLSSDNEIWQKYGGHDLSYFKRMLAVSYADYLGRYCNDGQYKSERCVGAG